MCNLSERKGIRNISILDPRVFGFLIAQDANTRKTRALGSRMKHQGNWIISVRREFGAVFNWVSKLIRNCFAFPLIRSVIGWKNSRRLLNQSDAKPNPIATWSHASVPALGAGHVYLLRVLIGSLCYLRLLWLVIARFWFYVTQLKTAV